MNYGVVPLHPEHLDKLIEDTPYTALAAQLRLAYFSPGSSACALLVDGTPVFAGGIVNMLWNRGEAWILPTPFLRSHPKICLRELRLHLPRMAAACRFERIQATCIKGVSGSIFEHLGFLYEGTLLRFGPHGETCNLYARIFELERP
jgi:hypothetical protein